MIDWVRPQWKRIAKVSGRKLHWWMARRDDLRKAGLLKLDHHWMLDEAAALKWAAKWKPSKPPGSRAVKPRKVPAMAEQIAAWLVERASQEVVDGGGSSLAAERATALHDAAWAIREGRWRK